MTQKLVHLCLHRAVSCSVALLRHRLSIPEMFVREGVGRATEEMKTVKAEAVFWNADGPPSLSCSSANVIGEAEMSGFCVCAGRLMSCSLTKGAIHINMMTKTWQLGVLGGEEHTCERKTAALWLC